MLARETEIVMAALKYLGWNLALAPHCSIPWASDLPVLSLTTARVQKVNVDKESHSIQNLLCGHFRDGTGVFLLHFPPSATGKAEQYKSRKKRVLVCHCLGHREERIKSTEWNGRW